MTGTLQGLPGAALLLQTPGAALTSSVALGKWREWHSHQTHIIRVVRGTCHTIAATSTWKLPTSAPGTPQGWELLTLEALNHIPSSTLSASTVRFYPLKFWKQVHHTNKNQLQKRNCWNLNKTRTKVDKRLNFNQIEVDKSIFRVPPTRRTRSKMDSSIPKMAKEKGRPGWAAERRCGAVGKKIQHDIGLTDRFGKKLNLSCFGLCTPIFCLNDVCKLFW